MSESVIKKSFDDIPLKNSLMVDIWFNVFNELGGDLSDESEFSNDRTREIYDIASKIYSGVNKTLVSYGVDLNKKRNG